METIQREIPTLAQLAAAVVSRNLNENHLSKIGSEESKRRQKRIEMLNEDEARVIEVVKQNFEKKREQARAGYHARIAKRETLVPRLDRAKVELRVTGLPTSVIGFSAQPRYARRKIV